MARVSRSTQATTICTLLIAGTARLRIWLAVTAIVWRGSRSRSPTKRWRRIDLLVIANATGPGAQSAASAFSEAEVAAVERRVHGGDALLLVADHEPWPAAAGMLASRFGVEFKNAYAYDEAEGSLTYRTADGSLGRHAVTEGIDAVGTFLGSTFRIAGAHVPLMRLSASAVARPTLGTAPHPDEQPIGGWLQGALLEHG
jgi:hypothetical protein